MFIPTYLFLKADDNHEDKINVQKIYSLKLERKPRVLIVANRIECLPHTAKLLSGRKEESERKKRKIGKEEEE